MHAHSAVFFFNKFPPIRTGMKTITAQQNGGTISPSVHLEFIQNQVGLSDSDSLEEIEAYHRALFLHQHAGAMEMNQQQARIHEDRLAHMETRLKEIHTKLGGLEKLVPVRMNGEADIAPTAPWNNWDRFMFAIAALGIL